MVSSVQRVLLYVKIFAQIFDSSIVEKPEARFTFMDLLILADSDGVVDMTHEAISRRTNRPLDLIRSTIMELESPDHRSRTKDADGARLKRLDAHRDWGWLIINYDRFRNMATELQRREKTRLRVKKHRERIRSSASGVTQCNAHVTPPYASPSPLGKSAEKTQPESTEVKTIEQLADWKASTFGTSKKRNGPKAK